MGCNNCQTMLDLNWIWTPDLCLYVLGYFCTDYGQTCWNRHPSTTWFWQNRDLCLVPVACLATSSSGLRGPCYHSGLPPWARVLVLSSQWEDKGTEDACAFPWGCDWEVAANPCTHTSGQRPLTTASPERLGSSECGRQGPRGSWLKGGEMDAGGSMWSSFCFTSYSRRITHLISRSRLGSSKRTYMWIVYNLAVRTAFKQDREGNNRERIFGCSQSLMLIARKGKLF